MKIIKDFQEPTFDPINTEYTWLQTNKDTNLSNYLVHKNTNFLSFEYLGRPTKRTFKIFFSKNIFSYLEHIRTLYLLNSGLTMYATRVKHINR